MTFREQYMQGAADFEDIFDLTDEWNYSDDTRTLREYLGLTPEEEDVWISESDDALEELLEQERRRWIFFTDLDDTLLNRRKEVSPENREALEELLRRGHLLVISTGRASASALRLARDLALDRPGCYAMCFNGAQILRLEDHALLTGQILSAEVIDACCRLAKDFGMHIQAYDTEDVVVLRDDEEIRSYAALQSLTYRVEPDLAAALPQGTPKMLCIDLQDRSRLEAFRQLVSSSLPDQVDVYLSARNYLEIVPKGVNKGTAVLSMCENLGIPSAHTIAAGDQENDLTMLQTAAVGCAMANAIPPVKAAADYVTENDCDHSGVAELLNKFLLKRGQ